jgi:transcription-repair coupling factor (superfamily II helicase)
VRRLARVRRLGSAARAHGGTGDHRSVAHRAADHDFVRVAIIRHSRRQERRRRKITADPNAILRDLQTLAAGSPVVHEEYGVGRYVGLQTMDVGGQSGEFLVLEYQDGDRLYVPVQSLHLVSRYSRRGAGERTAAQNSVPINGRAHDAKPREKVRDVAAELLDLYTRSDAHRRGLALAASVNSSINVVRQRVPVRGNRQIKPKRLAK